jgi:hypothetical protein
MLFFIRSTNTIVIMRMKHLSMTVLHKVILYFSLVMIISKVKSILATTQSK